MQMKQKKWRYTFGAVCLSLSSMSLEAGPGYNGVWDIFTGYRHDAINWSIAGLQGVPNICAEIDWQNIHSIEIGSRYILAGNDSIYFRGEGYWGWILQQDAQYSVYALDNREGVISREMACRGGDQLFGAKGGLGLHLCPCSRPYDLAFLVGYSIQEQRIRFRDPKIIENFHYQPGECISHLVVKYRPQWSSGFVGVDGTWRYKNCITMLAQYELHFGTYRAKGRWRYKERMIHHDGEHSHHHREHFKTCWKDCSTAWGNVFNLTVTYHTSSNWHFGVNASAQYWKSTQKNSQYSK